MAQIGTQERGDVGWPNWYLQCVRGATRDVPRCGRSKSTTLVIVNEGLLRKVDAVTVKVPDLDAGLAFYAGRLGHVLNWRNDEIGQAGLALPDSDTEIVLTTEQAYEPNWLVKSADTAAAKIVSEGGTVVAEPFDIPVGRVAVVSDPFGNVLVLVDLTKGRYTTEAGRVTDVQAVPVPPSD